jgi:excisionase family DNA binding protein
LPFSELFLTSDQGKITLSKDMATIVPVWLTVCEAAQYLKVKVRTLLLWVRQGKVKAFALSGTKRHVWRFRREDLDAALMASPVLPSKTLSVRCSKGRSIQ